MSKKKNSNSKKSPALAKQGFVRRHGFSLALLIITFIVFGNGIFNKYALDDEFYTAGSNKYTQQGIKAIPKIFTTRTFYNNDGSGYSYRPVALTSFAIEIQLFGEHPEVSHFVNVLLYAFTVMLLFALLRRWFHAQGNWFSFFIALLFLLHPLHTEVVDNIKCRDELLAILAGVGSTWLLWRFMETGKWWLAVLYPLTFMAGMLAKATIMPFYVLIPLALWFFSGRKFTQIALYMLPLVAVAGLVLLIKNGVLPESVREYQTFENPITGDTGFVARMATAAHVLGRYLWLHIVPHPLVYYYGHSYVPLATWADPVAIAGLLVHLGLLALGLWQLRKRTILSFGILFYLVSVFFYSNLITPAPGLMAERFAYIAVLGFCIVLVWGVFKLLKLAPEQFAWSAAHSSRVRMVLLGLGALYALRTMVRNEDWEDKHSLYGNDMEYLSESAKANMLYGSLLSADGARLDFEGKSYIENSRRSGNINEFNVGKMKRDSARTLFAQARDYYRQATVIAPKYYTAWSNYGTTYYFLGDFKSAVPLFRQALVHKPDYTEGLFNLGMSYDSLRKPDSAMYFLRKCIASDSAYSAAYDPLSKLMFAADSKAEPKIMALLNRAVANNPKSELPYTAMMNVSMLKRDTAAAVAFMDKAAELNPTNQMRMYQLAMYYQQHGNAERAAYWQNKLSEFQRESGKRAGKRRSANQ